MAKSFPVFSLRNIIHLGVNSIEDSEKLARYDFPEFTNVVADRNGYVVYIKKPLVSSPKMTCQKSPLF